MHVRITGKVQGVSFRYYTQRKARELGLSGWVRNCSDDSVESLISGSPDNINLMTAWFSEGSPSSTVDEVISEESDHPLTSGQFHITY